MTHRSSARAEHARADHARKHRQLEPTDAHNPASGANSRQVYPETSSPPLLSADESAVPGWVKRRVLLLNATYEPLTAVPVRRAVVLLVCEKADPVHEDPEGAVLHSAERTVTVPSVIRLRNYVRVPYRARIPMTRAALMHRDRFRCAYCGGKAETIDHVVPRSRGGDHSWENCVASCASCNHRKADKLLSELGWTMRANLVPPKGPHWRLLATTKELDPSWLRYLGEGAA
ncbi:HNH endonuclease [Aldersonia kunmingensis]|uniref:HNH endonuclease n=1 Tax=Aldersonia kunmingensis TaxID=408066 RepID=UPI000A0510F6|nr:HNH endonuclease [Aldersonia kunmingensis]